MNVSARGKLDLLAIKQMGIMTKKPSARTRLGYVLVLCGAVLALSVEARAGHAPTPGPPPPSPPPGQNPPPCGQNRCCGGGGGKPVDFWNGREFLTHTDLELPGRVGIAIRRSYDSQAQFDSALGYGWSLNYFARIYEYVDGSVTLRRDCGVRRAFQPVGGAYQTPVGERGTLEKNADGTWTYSEPGGDRQTFDTSGRLRVVESRGRGRLVFTYDSRGRLPLVGLSPHSSSGTALEVAREDRLLRIEELDLSGTSTGRWVNLSYDDATGRLTALADSAGRSVAYQHDGIGNLTSVTLPEAGVLNYAYEDPRDSHNATTLTDSACTSCGGGEYVNVYDALDRVIRQQHGFHVLRIQYEQPLVKTSVIEETYDSQGTLLGSATTVWDFNALGNPMRVTDALGNYTVYLRDPQMNVTREERWESGPSGPALRAVTERTYNSLGNLVTSTEAKGTPQQRTTVFGYDVENRVIAITRPSVVNPGQARLTNLEYDPSGNIGKETETGFLGDGTPFAYATTYAYDTEGRLIRVDGPRTDVEDVTTLTYQGAVLTSVTRPLSLTTTYSNHTATGKPQTVTDPNGVSTTYTYDSLGRVRTATVSGHTTSFTYTTTGNVETVTFPKLNTMHYSYDGLDHLAFVENGLGHKAVYTCDSRGNRLTEELRDSSGTVHWSRQYGYDALGRLARILNPDGTFQELGYDSRWNRTSDRNPRGHTTTYGFDSLARAVSVVKPGGINASYGYDLHDNLTSLTDPEGRVTSFRYDDMGRVYRETSPDSGATTHGYDAAGNRTSKTDARGVTVTYSYDALNRPTRIDFPTDADVLYTYDTCPNGKGRLCGVTDAAGTTSYAYSPKGQLVEETRLRLGVAYTSRYGYDANGNRTSVTYPSGRVVTYAYDAADEVASITTASPGGDAQAIVTEIVRRPFGPVASLAFGNGLVREVSHDRRYFATRIRTAGVMDVQYAPDGNLNVVSVADALVPSRNRGFVYDSVDRLTSVSGPLGSLAWSYDGAGNRLTEVGPEGTTTYAYASGTNRLVGLSGGTPRTFSHDASGNTVLDGSRSYAYGEHNRLTQVVDGGIIGEYVYDARGLRGMKTAGGATSVFHYGPEKQILAVTRATGETLAEYVYVDGEPVAKLEAAGVSYIQTDHLATAQQMTGQAGTKTWEIQMRPFGDRPAITGTASLDLRFPGQHFDDETDLHQNRQRDYDPSTGRYLQVDPIASMAGFLSHHGIGHYTPRTPDGQDAVASLEGSSPYLYANANPVAFVDPDGLAKVKNNCKTSIPYKHENDDYKPPRMCKPGETCDVDGVYSPPGTGKQCAVKIPDNCRATIDENCNLRVVCVYLPHPKFQDPTSLGPPALGGKAFKNWPDPYTGRQWPFDPWDPKKGCTCPNAP
jgi:RHS repeat-associated protein